jgi:ParB family chromosome partitioning protein
MKKATGLGKGLSALISERKIDIASSLESKGKRDEITTDQLFPSKFQPRVIFDNDEMEELAESIKRNGVVQPILVRARRGYGFEIIAGERRWRACKMINLATVPSIILDVDDRQASEIALIENVQRQNLTVLEEAEGYKKLIREFKYTQEQLADVMGKSRSHVTNLIRLLGLPEGVKKFLNEGKLSAGHARALLSAPEPIKAAEEVIKKNYSVRQTENFVKKLSVAAGGVVIRKNYSRKKKNNEVDFILSEKEAANNASSETFNNESGNNVEQLYKSQTREKEPEILMMEEEISDKSGFKVEIFNKDESGQVVISYSKMEELDSILRKLES